MQPNLNSQRGTDGSGIRFIGVRFNESHEGWEITGKVEEVPFHYDYVKAVKNGTLAPADEATANMCGVPLDRQSE